MKKLILLLTLFALSVSANPPQLCKGTKADKTPCKSSFVMADGYCKAHSPTTLKCGAMTSKKQPCKMMVSKAGEKCRFHQ